MASKICGKLSHTLLLACIAGAFLTLAFHPFDQFYGAPISLASFLYLLSHYERVKHHFLIGFCFGIGHFTTSLYWIAYALFIEADKFAWLIPFAVLLIPSCIAFFIAILAVIIGRYLTISKIAATFLFPSVWVVIEMLRSYLIFPFPWNLLGYASNFSVELMQSASIIGVYGLSFVFALCGSALYSRSKWLISGVCLVMIILYNLGNWRIDDGLRKASIDNKAPNINLRLVQPNITDYHFGRVEKQISALKQLVHLSLQEHLDTVDFLIWPESAFPFIITHNSLWLDKLRKILPTKTILLFGADRYDDDITPPKSYNSIFSINHHSNHIGVYDKNILVPFGEYQPFRKILPFLDKITHGMQDFEPGQGFNMLQVDEGLNIKPFICYEAIFSPIIFNGIHKKSLFLLNITNDFWFGNSIGPYQHFAIARMRAIEYGTPLVRVANTGISAVIDAYGNVLQKLNLNSSGIIDINVKMFQIETHRLSGWYGTFLLLLILSGLVVGVANYVIHLYK